MSQTEEEKLVAFFRGTEAMDLGQHGDDMRWSPAETAIHYLRDYLRLSKLRTPTIVRLEADLSSTKATLEEMQAKLNSPELHDFAAGVVLEAAHQRERWGAEHDAGKSPDEWFWLIAHLATKAKQALVYDDPAKALHHIITTAAALANWHSHVKGPGEPFQALPPKGGEA